MGSRQQTSQRPTKAASTRNQELNPRKHVSDISFLLSRSLCLGLCLLITSCGFSFARGGRHFPNKQLSTSSLEPNHKRTKHCNSCCCHYLAKDYCGRMLHTLLEATPTQETRHQSSNRSSLELGIHSQTCWKGSVEYCSMCVGATGNCIRTHQESLSTDMGRST